jgi:hypothetical protein
MAVSLPDARRTLITPAEMAASTFEVRLAELVRVAEQPFGHKEAAAIEATVSRRPK